MAELTTSISVQIDKEDKKQATIILQKLGVSMSGLINMTIKQLIMKGGIPFDVSIPKEEYDLHQYFTNEELENTAKELIFMEKNPQEYKTLNNIEELKEDLLSND